jgi:hypothetical protein
MVRKNKTKTPMISDAWEIKTEIQINGRNVAPNTELKISGERGRFRFIKYVDTGTTQWVDVWGGTKGGETWRSFRLEQVKTVHYKNRTVQNLAVEYKQKQKDKKEDTL